MPYSLVKEDIEKSLKSKWKALRKMHRQRIKPDDKSRKTDSSRDCKFLWRDYRTLVSPSQSVNHFVFSAN